MPNRWYAIAHITNIVQRAKAGFHRRKRYVSAFIRAQGTNIVRTSQQTWRDNLPEELAFWDDWIRSRGGKYSEVFSFRLNPDAPLQPEIAKYVTRESCSILDVGAGPLTYLGKQWNGHRLAITAVDPLADEYKSLLDKYDIHPLVQTLMAEGESLTRYFALSSFDLAHARNCLDHSVDPTRAIDEMVAVTKPGGIVHLTHKINEGQNEEYSGLHRWNFQERNGDFVIASPGRRSTNITKRLRAKANVSTVITTDDFVVVVITKY